MKKQIRRYISDSEDLPGWIWVTDVIQGFSFLMPRSHRQGRGDNMKFLIALLVISALIQIFGKVYGV
jgi:hypothetical protein